tara:strand:+ start:1182 stop:3350 length:2169 start_codon:yes stop_codon:yes gene_type:complete
MMQKTIFIILLSIVTNNLVFSQTQFFRDTSINVTENGITLKNAWASGINSAQFHEIDLDLDGVKDLLIFDKSGDKIIPYLNRNGDFIFAPKYRLSFPKLHDWVILADYNCDGKNDIYTYSSGGMAIYENTSNSSLSFNLTTPLVYSNMGGPMPINIYISAVDIPAVADIDYDGDLDVLTFKITGGFIEYHRNMSIELTGNCDTIAFQLEESCWGNFYEGLNNYTLNCLNCQCPSIINNHNSKQKHAGSTLLAIDIDNDQDKDLILGDISFNNLNLLINGGDSSYANMVSVDSIFPANHLNTIEADMDIFPAAYYLDVTNDGIKDLIVTSNSENNSENFESCWLFNNTGTNTNADFNFFKKNLLQDEMIDLGSGCYPVFYDYNNDGLDDIVVGNYGYHQIGGNPRSSLALFKNNGTLDTPSFELIDRDWQNISNINLNINLNIAALNLTPTFGDLDGDTHDDMIIGDANGKLHYFKNTGSNPANFMLSQAEYNNIDVGYFASPQLIDVNRDGLLDILIGEQSGTINYCENTGTLTNAIFDTVISNFGGIDIESNIISAGFSNPTLFDNNGNYELYVGSYTGETYVFDNIDNNLTGSFDSLRILNTNEGGKNKIAINDINNDQKPDLLIGNYSGGLSYFNGDSIVISNTFYTNSPKLKIYPNPSSQYLIVSSYMTGNIEIINTLGATILIQNKTKKTARIDLRALKKGLYFIKLNNQKSKLVIQ